MTGGTATKLSDTRHGSWRSRLGPRHQSGDETEFLPAALEVRDTPASPHGRAIVWLIVLFFTSAVVWATVGRIDIVAVAPGKIIPAGHSKVIQSLETAAVVAIHVQDGDPVEAGQLLLELDASLTVADVHRLKQEEVEARRERQRLQQLAEWAAQPSPTPISSSDTLLAARINEHVAQIHALDTERQKLVAERGSTAAQLDKLKVVLPIVAKRADSLKRLLDKQMAAEQQYLEIEQQRLETQHDLYALEKKVEELDKGVLEAAAHIAHAQTAFRKQTLEQIEEAERRLHTAVQELTKAEVRHRRMTLRAPVSGVIQQLSVHTIGAVVTPAQILMVIVPETRRLEVEALLLNKDIGFVYEGQEVEVKVDAFNFTKYGVIPARVGNISDDAIQDEKLGWVYKLKIALERSHLHVDNKNVALAPGMTVITEVKTGNRRIVEYFLAPLLRGIDESITER